MVAIKVDKKVFEQLKQEYSRSLGRSPIRLINILNSEFSKEINKAADGSGDLISDKTIRNFFKSSTPPRTQEKNLNYLCKVLLKCESYQDALEKFVQEQENEQEEWLNSYWDYIKEKCGTMQVLDMTQPVHLDNIYTQVNILGRRRKQRTIDEILAVLEDEKQERIRPLSVSPVIKEQVSGLEAVKHHRRLMVLGLPGSGKTTLSKHIAMHFREEELSEPILPVYIELKKFVEDKGKLNLIDAVIREFDKTIRNSEHKDIDKFIRNSEQRVQKFLAQGQCLVLLDGLDEVRDADIERVTRNIDDLVNQYPKNRFVVTCRVSANDYVFNGFTVVEIADFGQDQVEKFVYNWFGNRATSIQAQEFLTNIKENSPLEKLTTNPLLLTILCLLFEHGYDLSKHRHSLYEDAVNVFLERWDSSRHVKRDPISPERIDPNQNPEQLIKREQIYREKLTKRRKISLFADIAYHAFDQDHPKLFWWRWELENAIRGFIENLPGIEPENLDIDSQDILKALESNHGLLIEQANKYYSFSHLTFQEYFTAQYIIENRTPNILKDIGERHLLNRQWREVFLIVAGRLPHIDDLLKIILHQANTLVKSNTLQELLRWLNKVTTLSGVDSSSWRAFFLTVDLDIDLYLDRHINIDRKLAQKLAASLRHFNKERGRILKRTPKCQLILYLSVILTLAFDLAVNSNLGLQKADSYVHSNLEVEKDPDLKSKLEISIKIAKDIELTDLAERLTELQTCLPTSRKDDLTSAWQKWAEDLQKVLIQYLDIGYKVSLSQDDSKNLENYIYVNQLIVECLMGDSYSSKGLRERVIDSLLLPSELIPSDLLS